jgi:hypothetical protein
MKYQLVIQFSGGSTTEFDELIGLEDSLTACITGDARVDGHDFGSGEFNIFVLTNDPNSTFRQIQTHISAQRYRASMRAGYRSLDGEAYTVLWPPTLREFTVA